MSAILVLPASAQEAEPGTLESLQQSDKTLTAPKALDDIFASESGLISVSIDGVGSNDATSGADVQVDKPAGATVRKAYLLTAPTPRDNLSDITISNGGSSLTIGRADYDAVATGADDQENGRIDITDFIKPIVDAAPAGRIDFTIVESSTFAIDGEVLVVIFDDPNVSDPRSVVLVFGAQEQAGDSFNIGLADPFDNATQDILMSLGISFGYQGFSGTGQVSLVDVNGQRLTSAAGGQDDCDIFEPSVEPCAQNGALLTVGGLGDDPASPADPSANDSDGARSDDELYTLDEFIDDGDNNILVETSNPSFDDNIFFAAFIIRGTAAVVGEGIVLGPTNATNPVGTDHTVTATVQDDDGNPITGRTVDFEVTAGPNSGLMASATTDAGGEATFTWSSSAAGTDIVVASTVDSEGEPLVSNEAQKTWVTESECDIPTLGENMVDEAARTVSNTISDQDGIDSFTFSTLNNFTVASIAPMAGYTRSGDTWTWTDMGPAPTSVDFTLQAGPSGEALYFLEVTDACADPGPNTTDFDPPFDLGVSPDLAFTLEGSYPNPTGGAATVSFSLNETDHAQLSVYDVMGRKVATLVDRAVEAGEHEVRWNGRAADGSTVASGVYLLRLQAGERVATRRLTVVK
jgi:hypothetical protein